MFYEPIWIPNFPTISNRPNRPNNRPRHQPQIRFRPPRLTWNFTLNVIFWCASLPRIYSTHIWKLLTTFLKSAQQEKQETVVKQEKGKSHGPWHSLLRFVPYVLTVICPYIRTVYRVTLRIAHQPAAGSLLRYTVYCIHLQKTSCFVFRVSCFMFTGSLHIIHASSSNYRAMSAYGVIGKIRRYSKKLSSSGRRGIHFQLGESSPTSVISCNRHQPA